MAEYDWAVPKGVTAVDPVMWTLEGSNDGSTWSALDDRYASRSFATAKARAFQGRFAASPGDRFAVFSGRCVDANNQIVGSESHPGVGTATECGSICRLSPLCTAFEWYALPGAQARSAVQCWTVSSAGQSFAVPARRQGPLHLSASCLVKNWNLPNKVAMGEGSVAHARDRRGGCPPNAAANASLLLKTFTVASSSVVSLVGHMQCKHGPKTSPCTVSGADPSANGTKVACCGGLVEKVEARPKNDPAYSKYKTRVMCRQATQGTTSPSASPVELQLFMDGTLRDKALVHTQALIPSRTGAPPPLRAPPSLLFVRAHRGRAHCCWRSCGAAAPLQ